MLSDDEILAIVNQELSTSNGQTGGDTDNTDLEASLDLYLGKPMDTEVAGRSQIVSTDVADSIEWILPQIMKSFTQNNEVVIFDPIHQGDELQAELESEYVYEILMKQNDGFIILHQFVKDALMQRNGILKVYYANKSEYKITEYTGITQEQMETLLQNEGVEILEKTEAVDQDLTRQQHEQAMMQYQQQMQQMQQQMQQSGQQIDPSQIPPPPEPVPVMVYEVKISAERIRGKIYVDPVPPEEFRINSNHNSINPDGARFTAHVIQSTISDVLEEYPESTFEELKEIAGGGNEADSEYRFYSQDESYEYGNESSDESQQELEISECFMKIDIDQTGIAKLMKITVTGSDTPTTILSIEGIDSMPWVATTAFLMSHKFQGLSITDRLVQIQKHKTALLRNMLDNVYLQNNQRHVVIENQVNMDDLLISRPGGLIRAKSLNAVMPLATPQLSPDVYNMMEYLDKVRAGRTGVDAEGGATPQDIGDRVGSQGVDRMMNAKEELVGLIIRVIAETGIKPLCTKIRDLTTRHIDAVVDFRYRGVWYKIRPSQWPDRTLSTVRVGTGTGNHNMQIQALGQVMQIHEKLAQDPSTVLTSPEKVFNSLDDFCKFSGLNGANRYFTDPTSPEGQQKGQQNAEQQQKQKQEQQQMMLAQTQSQVQLAQAELQKAQAQQDNVHLKAQSENFKNKLEMQKQSYDLQIEQLNQQLEAAKAAANAANQTQENEFKNRQLVANTALKLTELEIQSGKDESENYQENKNDAA